MAGEVAAAINAVPVTNVGWTWTATMGAIQNVILLLGGSGIGGLILRAIVQMKRIGNERAKQDDDRQSSRWNELMGYNTQLTQRIEKLELDLRDERKRCDEEMREQGKIHNAEIADMRKEHLMEVKALNEKMDGLQRMIFQNQMSTAQVLAMPPNAPKALESVERVGKALRAAEGKPDD